MQQNDTILFAFKFLYKKWTKTGKSHHCAVVYTIQCENPAIEILSNIFASVNYFELDINQDFFLFTFLLYGPVY